MAMTLPKTLERKLEAFKKTKGPGWSKELESLLDEAVTPSVEAVLRKASQITVREAERILDKPHKAAMSDKQASKVAREAVIKLRQNKLRQQK